MKAADLLFYAFAFLILVSGILVVSLKNLLHSALALVATLAFTAALFILLGAEFVAAAQVLVYIGGVVVFIVFAILLTSSLRERSLPAGLIAKFLAVVALSGAGSLLALLVRNAPAETSGVKTAIAPLRELGLRFLSTSPSGLVVPFEIISLLLIAAVIGAIAVARRAEDDQEGKS